MVVEASFKFSLATIIIMPGSVPDVIITLYTMELWWHLPSNGQLFFFLQLHGGMVWLALALLFGNILLCLEVIVAMLGKQLQLTSTFFLLQILCKWWWGGRCLASSLRNSQPMLVVTCMLYCRLNHTMLRFLAFLLVGLELLMYCSTPCICSWALSLRTGTALVNFSWLHKTWERQLLRIDGSCFW